MKTPDRDNQDDIPIGSQEDRETAIDLQFNITVIFLFDEMACHIDEVLEGVERLKNKLLVDKKNKKETPLEKAKRILDNKGKSRG
jgi:hypothetical protein